MATKKYYKPNSTTERQERIRSIKSPSNRSKVGCKKGSYSFDRYGFVRKDNLTEEKGGFTIASLSALDNLKTGRFKRVRKVA